MGVQKTQIAQFLARQSGLNHQKKLLTLITLTLGKAEVKHERTQLINQRPAKG